MRLIRFDVDFQGNRDITLNGRLLEDPRAVGEIEEKIIAKNATLDQQWALLTLMKKLTAQLEDVYRRSRLQKGEGGSGKVFSGLKGLSGTNLPDLRQKP